MVGGARRALRARRDSLSHAGEADATEELLEVEAALARIEAGTWGHCERCHSAIGRDRLRAVPEARTCLSCGR